MPKKLSASALAKLHNRTQRQVVEKLLEAGLMKKTDNGWELTEKGIQYGGEEWRSKRFGGYLVWPDDIFTNRPPEKPTGPLLTSTKLGTHFGLSPTAMNKLLAEIGWIARGVKGWNVTPAGKAMGGFEKCHHSTGIPYVVWPQETVSNKILVANVNEVKGVEEAHEASDEDGQKPPLPASPEAQEVAAFRQKFEARYRCMDGHYVRSRAELTIDNWLYTSGLVHAYERKLPVEEDVYCDFYLPQGKVYVEYWGMEEQQAYARRKDKKIEIYNQYSYNLIELVDDDILSLDDVLPRKLLKFGVSAD